MFFHMTKSFFCTGEGRTLEKQERKRNTDYNLQYITHHMITLSALLSSPSQQPFQA